MLPARAGPEIVGGDVASGGAAADAAAPAAVETARSANAASERRERAAPLPGPGLEGVSIRSDGTIGFLPRG